MELLIPLLIIIIIIGALLGGRSFGSVVRKGCGFLIFITIVLIAIGLYYYSKLESEEASTNTEEALSDIESAYYVVIQDCSTYSKPDIASDTIGVVEIGQELFIEGASHYKYFYKLNDKDFNVVYVRKDCLEKK